MTSSPIRVALTCLVVPALFGAGCESPGAGTSPFVPTPDAQTARPDAQTADEDALLDADAPPLEDADGDAASPGPDDGGLHGPDEIPPADTGGGGGADGSDGDAPDDASAEETSTPDAGPGPNPDVNTAPPDAGLSKQPLAGVCGEDGDCDSGACNTHHPGGYCTVWCGSHDDCPGEARCFPDTAGDEKMCWKACGGDDDCRSDQFCAGTAGICTPKCTPGDCTGNYVCDEDTGQCFPPGQVTCEPTDEVCNGEDDDCDGVVDEGCGPGITDSGSVLIEDLGLVEVGGGGLSRTLQFDLSAAAGSFTILLIDADGSEELIALWNLVDPDDEVLVNGNDPLGSAIRAFPDPGVVTVQVPNTPLVDPQPGTYRFRAYREGPTSRVWVYVVQSLRQEPTVSALDVNFWFVGTPGLDAGSAPDSGKFQSLVATFEEVLNYHGIFLGNVEYHDVSGTAGQKYTFVDVSPGSWEVGEDRELVALSGELPEDDKGVNFFFVQGFNGYSLLGKAGGIPGPPLRHGTWGSGVIVSLADYLHGGSDDVAITAETMAHELGHQLGLFHTSEQTGEQHDPIPDTPECHTGYDKNGDGFVTGWECAEAGANNLMFWTVTGQAALSEGQKYVIHRNASMYEE